jgi:hypothetical protein
MSLANPEDFQFSLEEQFEFEGRLFTRRTDLSNDLRLLIGTNVRIPVNAATQTTGMLPPKPVKAATPSERSDAGDLFLLYLVSCRQIYLLFSE